MIPKSLVARILSGGTAVALFAGTVQAATATREVYIEAAPAAVWDAVRDVGAADRRLAPGFVVSEHMEGDVRTLTFVNGRVLQERIISVDDGARKLTIEPLGTGATYQRSSMQVVASGQGTRLVWATEVQPDSMANGSTGAIEKILSVIKATLERPSAPAGAAAKPGN